MRRYKRPTKLRDYVKWAFGPEAFTKSGAIRKDVLQEIAHTSPHEDLAKAARLRLRRRGMGRN